MIAKKYKSVCALVGTIFTFLLLQTKLAQSLKLEKSYDSRVTFVQHNDSYDLTIEENIPNATLFFIENAIGTPELVEVEQNNCSLFSNFYNITKNTDSNFSLILTKGLDYEQYCHKINAQIQDNSGGLEIFNLYVNNTDDSPPQFILPDKTKLTMNENQAYTKENTTCVLDIYDADGMMENTIFSIISESNDDYNATFKASFVEIPKHSDTKAKVAIYLVDGKTLDFENNNLYSFSLKAKEEITENQVQIVINVKDMPDQPPKWTSMLTNQQFPENEDQTFFVKAIDGDLQIHNNINYIITENGCTNNSCEIEIDKDGKISVTNVDREIVGDTILLQIKADEIVGNPADGNCTYLDITFFIQDEDDELPKITLNGDAEEFITEVDENYIGSITTFEVTDKDLGDNGTFDVKLSNGESEVNYIDAFQVIPNSGYQDGCFTLTVSNSTKLDYENDDWKVIVFKLQAIEKANTKHIDIKNITIKLNDLNDEPPIFLNDTDTVTVPENIKMGEKIFNAEAHDKDANSVVSYQIVGIWNKKLNISESGVITPIENDVFDYEQLQQVVIQIRATDNDEVHEVFKTLTINVTDIDDESPSVIIGKNRVSMKENSTENTGLEEAVINATDPDEKPDLSLEIDWSNSVITKNSRIVDAAREMWQCFVLNTAKNDTNSQTITGKLSINDKICLPDFELFDSISISIKTIDKNTEIGTNYSTGSILINIEDINDNPPEFLQSSLEGLEVTDGTKGVSKIGIISASDKDLNDNITYSIKPVNSEPEWVEIDEKTGQLNVKNDVIIDDDIPKRYHISYIITACDNNNTHCPNVTVVIKLIDVNDQKPKIIIENVEVEIEEKVTNKTVQLLQATDDDRDVEFHTVVFRFNTNVTDAVANCFNINEKGKIEVVLRNGYILDRDTGPGYYILPILAFDNPKGNVQYQDTFDLNVTLKDINDHSPELLNTTLECTENYKINESLGPILAKDIDEEGDHSNVKFEIIEVTPFQHYTQTLTVSSFDISTNDNKTAFIGLRQNLTNYYGQYNITIKTSDYGLPIMSQSNNITLTVKKFNFFQPSFIFPSGDKQNFVLDSDQIISSNQSLKLYNGQDLSDLEVDDHQNHKWEVSFKVTDEKDVESSIFSIVGKGWKGRLFLLKEPDKQQTYNLKIEASVKSDQQKGEQAISSQVVMVISFFDSNEQPIFENCINHPIEFKENSIDTWNPIPCIATFSSKVDITPLYSLLDITNIFAVDPNNGTISLKKALDYEEKSSYDIRIAAVRKFPPDASIQEKSILDVTVNVIDMNDHSPVFYPSEFVGAFLRSYNQLSTIVTINATDGDPRDENKLHFALDLTNMECNGNLKPPSEAFIIGPLDGKITPTFIVTSDMSGYCKFLVVVNDTQDLDGTIHSNSTTVQINIVSDGEILEFVFLNEDSTINSQQENITNQIDQIFNDFHYTSHIASLSFDPNYRNTTVGIFFLDKDSRPVEAKYIMSNLTVHNKYSQLQKSLAKFQVYLGNFLSPIHQIEDSSKIYLIALTLVLATLLMLVSISFFFRNKALTQRINNLSTTKFGSQESGLNRAGFTAPTTNKNAVEGSNPVFNSDQFVKSIDSDQNSIMSNESDLFVGIEENPDLFGTLNIEEGF